MSGGVDSSVAAALLIEHGYEVIGITMSLFSMPGGNRDPEDPGSRCGWKAAEDARAVASSLGIPHYIADFRKVFDETVVADFCREYARGRTPNPCIRCNEKIKFGLFLREAETLGAGLIATGHHARIEKDLRTRRYLLKKGRDAVKDQSYFLYRMGRHQLSRTLMPVGGLTKQQVREKARAMGLPVAENAESQEICFIPGNDYPRFLESRVPEAFKPGPILDVQGRILGEHPGILHFTVGQRRGMGIAAANPLYVLSIDPASNSIVVGPNEELYGKALTASRLNYVSADAFEAPTAVKAKIRYKHAEAKAVVIPEGEGRVRVEFEKAQRAVTPGQAVVFYAGDTVLGGGTIDAPAGADGAI